MTSGTAPFTGSLSKAAPPMVGTNDTTCPQKHHPCRNQHQHRHIGDKRVGLIGATVRVRLMDADRAADISRYARTAIMK